MISPLELLFPTKCVLCGRVLSPRRLDFCPDCLAAAKAFDQQTFSIRYLDGWRAAWFYEDLVRQSLLRYKFSGQRSYAKAYGRVLAAVVDRELRGKGNVVTYVPVSARRRRSRGYDQSALLAKAVGAELGMPVEQMLKKLRHNQPQSGIREAAARRANVQGAYGACGPVAGKEILLVDDILTTGETMRECARVLKQAGAKTVYGLALAARRSN